MMNEKKIVLSPEKMKAIARYETDFAEIMPFPEEVDDIDDAVAVPEIYRYTLDDLFAAVRNLIEKNPTIQAFYENWYDPLSQLEEFFCIDLACGDGFEVDFEKNAAPDHIRGLPVSDEDIFSFVWSFLENCRFEWEDEVHVADIPAFQKNLDTIELYFSECDKPVRERTFSDALKENYIVLFESDLRLDSASELELELCRQFTDELCEKDSVTALHLKGYACYGGNRLYPCDWSTSRDCMIRLYDKTDNAQYANTLGYIYYYGRCTDGEPEYEKAFEMFSVSAANGLFEGLYKLADLYRHGHACKKSPKTARHLYEMVYHECRQRFIQGEDNSFPDAALRMGNVYLQGIDASVNARMAYYYYLQADFAHRRRMAHSDFFGNTTVAINIQKSLDEAKLRLKEDFFCEYVYEKEPWQIYAFLEDNNRVRVSVEKLDNHDAALKIKRIPIRKGQLIQPVLLTEPELDWCELTDEIVFYGINAETSLTSEKDGTIIADYAEWNDVKRRIDFYYSDRLAGWIACDTYRLYGPKKPAPSGKWLRLASIRFQPNGRIYDYLCDDETIQTGDKVIVNGYNGETVVEVVKIYTQIESELGLPLERYKKVIGRAPENQQNVLIREDKMNQNIKFEMVTKTYGQLDAIKAIYEEAFPKNERPKNIEIFLSDDVKEIGMAMLAVVENEKVIGLLILMEQEQFVYGFYLAIDRALRGQGYGSKIMRALLDFYAHKLFLFAIETPVPEAYNYEQRVKREKFYLELGLINTGQTLDYANDNYTFFCSRPDEHISDYIHKQWTLIEEYKKKLM